MAKTISPLDHNDAEHVLPVAIIGTGESGIAMACQLKAKLGLKDFAVFERQAGIGGTWYINQYPGWYLNLKHLDPNNC
jgi:cation diffusion facilitator CzcD-associated flavoprotein CzcO